MKRRPFVVGLVLVIFFVISLLTNILGPLVPDVIHGFGLSLALAGFLPFSFFVAYGVMSIPAGMLVERYHEKPVLVASFGLAFVGSALFATLPRFGVALGSLFLIGVGMAMLQVAINPLLRVAGGEEHFAFFSVLAQLIFGLASFVSPHVYTYLVRGLLAGTPANALIAGLARVVPPSLPWVSLYWVFAVVTLVMVAALSLVRLPVVELGEDERVGALATHVELFRKPIVLLYFVGVFMYVGTEQGTANWMSQFLATYHGFDPVTEGASAVAMFWLLLTVGCAVGLLLLKLYDGRHLLVACAAAAMATLSLALFGPAAVSRWAFPAMGLCVSVMWSIILSLALNSVERHHGAFSGILCTGIVGGAVVPLVIGALGDRAGLRLGMTVLYLTLGYVLSIGIWARPLIANETTSLRSLVTGLRRRLGGPEPDASAKRP
jgi:FHS family L-fucose permease-like MFS transporter